jgi:ABC-type transport system involved in multi-copper enzyme maturation permease subunit
MKKINIIFSNIWVLIVVLLNLLNSIILSHHDSKLYGVGVTILAIVFQTSVTSIISFFLVVIVTYLLFGIILPPIAIIVNALYKKHKILPEYPLLGLEQFLKRVTIYSDSLFWHIIVKNYIRLYGYVKYRIKIECNKNIKYHEIMIETYYYSTFYLKYIKIGNELYYVENMRNKRSSISLIELREFIDEMVLNYSPAISILAQIKKNQ